MELIGLDPMSHWRDGEIPTKGRVCYRKHCCGLDDCRGRHAAGGYQCQIEFEVQCKNKTLNQSNPEYVSWGICKWLGSKSGKSFKT